jgi:hypothetical protein
MQASERNALTDRVEKEEEKAYIAAGTWRSALLYSVLCTRQSTSVHVAVLSRTARFYRLPRYSKIPVLFVAFSVDSVMRSPY